MLCQTSNSISELSSSVSPNFVDLARSVFPSAHEMPSYLVRDDDRGGPHAVKDTNSIGSAYDRYLQSAVMS